MTAGSRGAPAFGFGHADEHPYRRLTADWVKLPLSIALLVASALHVGDEIAAELRVDRLFSDWPHRFDGVYRGLFAVGTLWGVGLVVVAALVARRWRLGLVLGLGGVLAWFAARFVGLLVSGHSFGDVFVGVFDGTRPGSYPAVHLAVIAAVILTAEPFLTRPMRRLGQFLLALLTLAALVVGPMGVNDVFGAVVLAWGVAAVLHLAFGSPAGRPTSAQVRVSLEELNFPVDRVVLAPEQERGFTLMTAEMAGGGALPVKVYGRDAADTRLVAKAWRFLAYKDSGPTLTITRLQQVEHEALCLYAARDVGVPAPQVVVAGLAGPSAAILVTRLPPAVPLSADDPGINAQLRELWRHVARMRDARIAHGALDLEHVGAAADATVIDDFAMASVSAPDTRLDQDVAQLLVATASLVGEDTATRAAVDVLGAEVVGAALPYFQKPALSTANRRALRADKDLLDPLRETVTTATGHAPVPVTELRRVKPLNIAMFVGLLFALWVILGQVGSLSDLWDTMKTAEWPWLLLGLMFSVSTSVAWAFTTIGTVRQQIPLIPATLLQMAVSFANLVATTGAASTLMNIRFLQKQGVEVGPATSSGLVAGVSGTVAQFGLFIVTGLIVGEEVRLSQIGGDGGFGKKMILLSVVVVAVIAAVVFAVPKLRRIARDKVWPQVLAAIRNIWHIVSSPRQLFTVLGGAVAAQVLSSLCLLSCLLAYGGRLSFVEIVFVNTSASFLASLVPVPGGVGISEAALIAGLTAFGIPAEIATATVITHRLFTSYLPPIWGSQAMKWLVREGYL